MDILTNTAKAKQAAINLAGIPNTTKNHALRLIAESIATHTKDIQSANQSDIKRAEQEHVSPPLLKRLKFDEDKIKEALSGLAQLESLPDPVGMTLRSIEMDQGLELFKVTCPIGVIGVIFESRPDALVQISSLCLKSGNAVILKGGSEAMETNRILVDIISKTTMASGIPEGWLTLLETRADVAEMLRLDKTIDLIIPRGSNAFVKYIMDNTNIPVLGHADGICHVYVDQTADMDMAVKIVVDSKCQYVAVCNAAETLLVHEHIASRFLPVIKDALEQKGVEIRGCAKTLEYIDVKPANEADWSTEYLDLIISIKVVDHLETAIDHINRYGSKHTDVIVTADKSRAIQFMNYVDSANVFFNASSRFSDGYRFGLGAEVGISTNKIHARGPVGLEGLVIYKWLLFGNGHIVSDYSGKHAKPFTHRIITKTVKE
ncbi:MAG: glutamate-5-semialdehyde dehydrogenase [Desulfobacterales bacterium]|nr:glutamate-5-semialdehyde dehydrogenase [Desulfobacterales bacterium]